MRARLKSNLPNAKELDIYLIVLLQILPSGIHWWRNMPKFHRGYQAPSNGRQHHPLFARVDGLFDVVAVV